MSPTAEPISILVVDDDPAIREILVRHLSHSGHRCRVASDGEEGLGLLRAEPADLVMTDLTMPRLDGLALLQAMRSAGMSSQAVVLSGFFDIPKAVMAFSRGACDLVEKPFSLSRIDQAVEVARARIRLAHVRGAVAPAALDRPRFVGRSDVVRGLLDVAARVAPSGSTVLIEGETGVGKEIVARSIHEASPRRARPFIPVNCGALPESLVEAELFGHEKGAYTGASGASLGFFRAADGGTLFLDEVGELPLAAQVKLLRFLQEREVVPVGSSRPQKVDVRIIAATHRRLDDDVREGTFRRDLLYRLDVVRIAIPPLRERRDDVAPLVEHFIGRMNARTGRSVAGLEPAAFERLLRYDFPGNARELENWIERAFALGTGERIRLEDLPDQRAGLEGGAEGGGAATPVSPPAPASQVASGALPTLEESRRLLIERALEATQGDVTRAAVILGVSAKTISRHVKRLASGGEAAATDPAGGDLA